MTRSTLKYSYKIALYTVLGMLSSSLAFAQTSSGTSVSRAVEHMICQNLANKAIGEAAAYKPGVSASGRDVTPAEGDQQVKPDIREVVAVPLTVDLARRMGIDTPEGIKLDKQLGTLRIDRKGTIRFRDETVTDKARQLCKQQAPGGNKGPELPLPGEQDANKPPADLEVPDTPETPANIQSPNAPGNRSATPEEPTSGAPSMQDADASGTKVQGPDTPGRPSAPSGPEPREDAGMDAPVREPEMQRNREKQSHIQVPFNTNDGPRAYKLRPEHRSNKQP